MRIQLWQVPLLAMAVVCLAEWGIVTVLRRWPVRVDWRLVRIIGFSVAVLVASVLILVNYLSPADKVANVISAGAAIATLWLTYRAYQKPTTGEATQSPDGDAADRQS